MRYSIASLMTETNKKKDTRRLWLVLAAGSVLFAASSSLLLYFSQGFSNNLVFYALNILISIFIISIVLSLLVTIIANNLGGRGGFHQGLGTVAFALLPISASLLVASIFTALPVGLLVSAVSMSIGLAYGISLLYRGVKELFSVDMATSLVAISVLIITLFAAASVTTGLSAIMNLGQVI